MAIEFGMSEQGQKLGIANGFAPAADDGPSLSIGFSGPCQQAYATVEDSFAEICCRVRHNRAGRSVSFYRKTLIFSVLFYRDIA